jgi:hypothetical protein
MTIAQPAHSPGARVAPLLRASDYANYVDRFNTMEPETVVNLVPNAESWDWMCRNVPLMECPDAVMQETYYFRWWSFRKHLKQTPAGRIVTEFIIPVRHAGSYNSISCATGLHLAEGRWLRQEQEALDEYTRFWFHADNGRPEPRFHQYSSWIAAAMYDRYRATGDAALMIELLDALVEDYRVWEGERLRADGLFWQFDVRDGMEESISGSRTHRNARPTINSYMFASARAIAAMAKLAGRDELVETFERRAADLRRLVHERLWDESASFFKAETEEGPLCDAREAIGFIPWCFNLPQRGLEGAWASLIDPEVFWAPAGLTTAERRHRQFRSHGVGKCEWDGAVWPFATSQTLTALGNLLRDYSQMTVTREHYLEALRIYAASHQRKGLPYIGEYHDERTGEWLKGDNPRSYYYNHSTFADLIITGLAGLRPRCDDLLEISPLLPHGAWNWFCIQGVPYHGHEITIAWDEAGTRYGLGAGLSVLVDGRLVARRRELEPILCSLSAQEARA